MTGETKKCPYCGGEILADAVKCRYCREFLHGVNAPGRPTGRELCHEQKYRKHRLWLAVPVLIALILAPIAPALPLWFGIMLFVLCAGVFVPRVQSLSRYLLRLNPSEKWRSGLRLIAYSLVGLLLVLASWSGAEYRTAQERIAARQVAEEAELQRLVKEANASVAALVGEAESAWKNADSKLVEDKLSAAARTAHATNLSSIRVLRARIANAQVEILTGQATEAMQIGNIPLARERISAALAVPDASELAATRKLDEQIANGTDPAHVRAVLMNVPDDTFAQLKKEGTMPTRLVSGYEKLDKLAAELVLAQIPEVAVARERRSQEQLEREQAAAKARHNEERKKRIEKLFSAWDGSHRGLTRTIKALMHNPKSYEHVETVYWDIGDNLLVRTTYRGTNAFGGVVTNWIKAKVDLDGNVLAIVEQGS